MLTIDQLQAMPKKTVFATGEVENSPEGVYMTDANLGRTLLWAAKRGEIHDWAIYIHWADMGIDYVLSNGDKLVDEKNIRKLVPCDKEALQMYRR